MAKNVLNNEVGARRQMRESLATGNLRQKIALLVIVIIASFAGATQWFAHSFNYDPALGSHFNFVYFPWEIVFWYFTWPGQYGDIFQQSLSVGVVVMAVGLIGILLYQMVSVNSNKADPFLHGSAEWARDEDIKKSGLVPFEKKLFGVIPTGKKIGGDGVYVGAYVDKEGKQHYLRHNGPEHVLCYAPTRSGKGVGLVVPTLLSWAHGAVITDLKGELWALTSGWRKTYANNKVLRFEPASLTDSISWNPLNEIRIRTQYEVGDVQNLATLIVDPDGKGLVDHWQKTSQSLLVGVILHVLYVAPDDNSVEASLPGVDAILSDPQRDIKQLWNEMITTLHINGERVHPVIGAAARDMIDRPDEEAGSVLSTLKSYLALYRDPVVQHNVRHSDFAIKDLMNHADPVSLYIITQPNDKSRLKPLVRVMVNMIVRLLADKMDFEKGRPAPKYKHRLLMMLDEFPSLGKLEIMQESLAFIGGYGIKCYLICQDITQLRSRETGYGDQEQITSNCHIQNAYPPNRVETAEYLSKQTGVTTITKEQITTSGKRMAAMHGQVTRTVQSTQRPLMTADEMMRMPAPEKDPETGHITSPGDMVIFMAGMSAIYGRQPLYFQDPIFQKRAEVEPPKVSDRLIQRREAKKDEQLDAA